MDLDSYEESYNGYTFFQPRIFENNDAIHVTSTVHKSYLKATQGTPSPDAAGRSADYLNQSNWPIPVWYVLINNQSTVEI